MGGGGVWWQVKCLESLITRGQVYFPLLWDDLQAGLGGGKRRIPP